MKIFIIFIGLVICGCVSQSTELTQEESNLDVYYEEPNTAYENLGRIVATSRYDHGKDTVTKILSQAVNLGADAVIIHSSGNTESVAGDETPEMYQIRATAIRYVD